MAATPEGYTRHLNGGGLVAKTATVSPDAYVDSGSYIEGSAYLGATAEVFGSKIQDSSRVFGLVLQGSTISGNSLVAEKAVITGASHVCCSYVEGQSLVGSKSMLLGSQVEDSDVVDSVLQESAVHGKSGLYAVVLTDSDVEGSKIMRVQARGSKFRGVKLVDRDLIGNQDARMEVPDGYRRHRGGGLVSLRARVDNRAAVLVGCTVHEGASVLSPNVIIKKDIAPHTTVTEYGDEMTEEALEATEKPQGALATITAGMAKGAKTAGRALKVSTTSAAMTQAATAMALKMGISEDKAKHRHVQMMLKLALPQLVKLAATHVPQLGSKAESISNLMDQVSDQAVANVTDEVIGEVIKIAGDNFSVLADILGNAGVIEGQTPAEDGDEE